jgi:hypothetical protein
LSKIDDSLGIFNSGIVRMPDVQLWYPSLVPEIPLMFSAASQSLYPLLPYWVHEIPERMVDRRMSLYNMLSAELVNT